ncbi:MAG TPA: hypothetical protein DCO68_03360 [Methylophilaceae bacterium]|nr:hypothetical protein [Methylophilaceae bacterium]HAJ71096.1 hypothetical protein [Methylophilaceae bacterium]
MAYVLKNEQGEIVAASTNESLGDGWQQIEPNDKAYLAFLEAQLNSHSAFRESDIQLARVLEDLINILIERNLVQFTDFPSAAQKRLNDRQSMRRNNHKRLRLLDDDFPEI